MITRAKYAKEAPNVSIITELGGGKKMAVLSASLVRVLGRILVDGARGALGREKGFVGAVGRSVWG